MLVSDYVAIGVLIVSTALLGAKWWPSMMSRRGRGSPRTTMR